MDVLCLNIEGRVNLERVYALIQKEMPDVLCLQELYEETFRDLQSTFGLHGFFAPMVDCLKASTEEARPIDQWGIGILSSLPIQLRETDYYDKFTEDYPEFRGSRSERPLATALVVEIEATRPMVIATTHFTWAANGGVSDEQRVNLGSLFNCLDRYSSVLLCGDFNAPRGTEIYQAIASRFHDNVPPQTVSTLDLMLHRSHKKLVVDSIFTTPDFKVENVRVISEVSDHCALLASVY